MCRKLQTAMKKYNIIVTKKKLNGKFVEEYIHEVETGRRIQIIGLYGYHKEYKTEFSEEEVKAEMIDLLLEHSDNIRFVDDEYIREDIEEELNVSWYDGEGFYTYDRNEKYIFNPLEDCVEEEHCGHYYIYEAREIEE